VLRLWPGGVVSRLEVAKEPVRDQTRDEPVGVVDELGSSAVPEDHVRIWDEQNEEHGGIPG